MKKHSSFILYHSPFILLVLVLAILALPMTALAQDANPDTPTDDDINAIASEMFCPVCENVPLDVCGTQACAQWRALIGEKLSQGWTENEIKQYFVDQYGDRVLAEPPRTGFNWLVYLVPPVAFIIGAYVLFRGIQSWRQIEPETAPLPAETAITDDYVARLEDELRGSDW
ncbi:MAG: cytochrome c-type biogenesis protein CcmH [Anaerolineae bacterium]|nr:cytochrome c-type biogenesis protein CcmH [Anaerolineae bacterium]MBL6965046.1 cytochrome c-type biogenesis protein CcmH [Anaerolineales bacterium]